MAKASGEFKDTVYFEDLGDGLFRLGYDIFSTYPIKSHKIETTKVTYTFQKSSTDTTKVYDVVVSWTWNSTTKTKTKIKWERKYD